MCTRDTVEVEKNVIHMHSPLPSPVSQSLDGRCVCQRPTWPLARPVRGLGEYAIRARAYRLSHFHMNNIGYCVSHECLSFILIPSSRTFSWTTNRFHIFHAFGFIATSHPSPPYCSRPVGPCFLSVLFLSGPPPTQTQTPNDNNNGSGDGGTREHLNRVHRGLVRFAFERRTVFRCLVCFD